MIRPCGCNSWLDTDGHPRASCDHKSCRVMRSVCAVSHPVMRVVPCVLRSPDHSTTNALNSGSAGSAGNVLSNNTSRLLLTNHGLLVPTRAQCFCQSGVLCRFDPRTSFVISPQSLRNALSALIWVCYASSSLSSEERLVTRQATRSESTFHEICGHCAVPFAVTRSCCCHRHYCWHLWHVWHQKGPVLSGEF